MRHRLKGGNVVVGLVRVASNGIHRTAGPVTALATERGCLCRRPAEPGPRQDHPLVMPGVGQFNARWS
jgi:hypothetical protein